MKKITLTLAIATIAILSAKAQDGDRLFKRFKCDLSLGYAAPVGESYDGGALFAIEPKYAIMDKLSVGLRIEVAAMATIAGENGNSDNDKAKAFASYLATADYYFLNKYSFRPFVGAGVGAFGIAQVDDNSSSIDDAVTATKFGGLIRVGAEVGHFRFGVEYNIIPNSTGTSVSNSTPVKLKNGYIGLKIGVCFGGGPLNR